MAAPSALIIGSEAVPFAKTGGLADVLGALPPALARLGWDVTLVLPRYRGVSAGSLVDRFSLSVGGYTREIGCFEAPMPSGARAVLVDCPDLYDRDELYGSSRSCRLSGQRAALCRAGSRRVRVDGAERSAAECRARTRLAGRPRAGVLEDALRVAPDSRRHAVGVYDPQPRLSGAVRTRLAAACRFGAGGTRRRSPRILGSAQLPEGRHQRFCRRDHGEPHLCRRDSDAGVWIRL